MFFWSCFLSIPDAFEMGFSSITWKNLGCWLWHAVFIKSLCPQVTSCSGIYSVATSTRSVTREDWPPPQVTWGCWLLSLVQCSHYLVHRSHQGQNTFYLAPSRFLKYVVSLKSKTQLPECPPRSPRRTQGGLRLSDIASSTLHRCSRISWKVGGVAGSRPSRAHCSQLCPLTASVQWAQIIIQNPTECSVSMVTGS